MKAKFNFIVAFILFIAVVSQAQNHFEKRLAIGNDFNQARSIAQKGDGGYVAVGYNLFFNPWLNTYVTTAAFYNTNSFGDTLKTFEFFKNDTSYFHQYAGGGVGIFRHCINNNNNQVIAVASIQGHGASNRYDDDILLVKIGSTGDTLLSEQISHPNDSSLLPLSILQTYDNCYLIAGTQNSFYDNNRIGFVMKVDTNFNVLWRKSFINTTKQTYFGKALEAADQGVFLSGADFDNNTNNEYPILVKISSTGNELWRDNFNGVGSSFGSDITNSGDGNYIFSCTQSLGPNSTDSSADRYVKFDNNGNVLSSKSYFHNYADAVSLCQTKYDHLVTTGWLKNYTTQQTDAFVMGLDENGDSLWFRKYGGLGVDKIWDIAPTNDGGVILCGETYSNIIPGTNSNAWLLKLDSLGLLVTGINEQAWASNVTLQAPYPNPCNTQCTINTYIPSNLSNKGLGKTGNELQLYTLQGKPLQYIPIKDNNQSTTINTSNIASGTYLLVLVVNGYNVATQKIIIEKE